MTAFPIFLFVVFLQNLAAFPVYFLLFYKFWQHFRCILHHFTNEVGVDVGPTVGNEVLNEVGVDVGSTVGNEVGDVVGFDVEKAVGVDVGSVVDW